MKPVHIFLMGKWFIDELYDFAIVRPLEGTARFLWKGIDQAIVDGSVNGTGAVVEVSGEIIRGMQTGQVRTYAGLMFACSLALVAMYLLL